MNARSRQESCPLPEVAEALKPFIKTRQETNAIRQGLQSCLPLSPIHLGVPLVLEKINSSRLTSVQKAYYRALQAHSAAQKKYETVKTELAQLSVAGVQQAPAGNSNNSDETGSNLFTESYIPLIRQRENHRKLLVLSAALGEITQVGNDAHLASETFETIAKREVGELPGLPSSSNFGGADGTEGNADYDLLRLKKAILSTRRSIAEQQAVSSSFPDRMDGDLDPTADLKALQKTHMELTMWMESQLSLIGDVQPPTPKDAEGSNGTTTGPEFSIRDIEELYETYLASRARLLDLVAHPPVPARHQALSTSRRTHVIRADDSTTESRDQDPSLTPSVLALPYLKPLLDSASKTDSLSNLTSHLRRTLHNSDLRTQDLLARLADESHLLPPDLPRAGGTHGRDWKEAGREAGKKTRDIAMSRVDAGLRFAEKAEGTLEGMREMESGGGGSL